MADARGGAAGVAAFPAGEQPAGRAAGLSLGQGSSADSARAAALRGCARRRGGRSGVPAAVAPEGEVEDDVRGGGSARGRGRAGGGAKHASGGGPKPRWRIAKVPYLPWEYRTGGHPLPSRKP